MQHRTTRALARWATPVALIALATAACDETDVVDGDEQVYTATLTELNGSGVTGTARFTINEDDDEFTASVEASGLDPSIAHAEHIHLASACPDATADVNADGYVDVIEGVPSYGPILIPLDSDLSSQATGTFPSSDASGAISYESSTTLSTMLADLNATDPDPDDAVVKLDGEDLALSGRHVVLHGVSADTELPATVATLGTAPAQATLPVACGEIQ